MSTTISRATPIPPGERSDRNSALPPLENGDRLTREEFERRYDATPHHKKAELIVGEYIVWRVQERQLDWFVLRGSQYEKLSPGHDGIFRSEVFGGLWLDAAALLSDDFAKVLDVLEQGLTSPEHADFKARLPREKVS